MKMNFRFSALILAAGLLTAGISSCKKNNDSITADTQAANDNSYAEATFDDIYSAVDVSARNSSQSFFKTSEETLDMLSGSGITITLDSTGTAKRLTIDFGTGMSCRDGKTRSGQIIATWTGRYRDAGTVITVTLNNYTVNGDKVEGTKTVTNEGTNSNGNMYFKIEVTGAKITTGSGTISWSSTREREWTKGSNTLTPFDDEYSITGSASGTNIKGQTFNITITKPLIINLACRFIESGTFTIATSAGTSTGTVDFGDGTCDDLATFTYNGKDYQFHMR